ncbi:MAG TPA: sigma-70 family RNA polymerase sigma factor [Acidimicrobiia bacterium]|nr:sigma-70 family RNA polymerase sigma factor [Acidimicrobiia bacterium]
MWDASDDALLAGYATGDRDAASVFVRRHQARMVGLALLITRDRVEAEEVAQDAFVRAWRYAASYDPRRGPVSGWLLGIVRNVALDRVRVSSKRREYLLGEPAFERLLDQQPDAADSVGTRDSAQRIVRAMQVLPIEQRDALLAATLHGFSAREISDAIDVPLGTVKTRIRLGLRKLREQLGVQVA